MLRFRVLLGALFLACISGAHASIILPQAAYVDTGAFAYSGTSGGAFYRPSSPGMGSIVFYDTVPPRTNASYMAMRSQTWARYRNGGDPYRRFGMVYAPAVGSGMRDISDRQSLVREHISRATAYRLRYFDK